jgi:hypothetical protein
MEVLVLKTVSAPIRFVSPINDAAPTPVRAPIRFANAVMARG